MVRTMVRTMVRVRLFIELVRHSERLSLRSVWSDPWIRASEQLFGRGGFGHRAVDSARLSELHVDMGIEVRRRS